MYVLSVCTALHIPAPTADSALTLTSYSVPAASLGTMEELWEGEPEIMRWLPQEVVPCILYWRMHWEMGSSLRGMVQVARKAGNLDNTALDRDRPVTWEGTSKQDRRNYVKFHYYRYNTCGTCCVQQQVPHVMLVRHETHAEWHVHYAPKPLEDPNHQVTLLGGGVPYKEWHNINDIVSIISDTNHFHCTNYQQT